MDTIPRPVRLVALVAASIVMSCVSAIAADAPQASSNEAELLAILRSDAPKSEKAVSCKRLAVFGSSESVAELAKLLRDEQLASWARIALEAIPGDEADAALRNALDGVQGELLIGVINSLGVRRDATAVAPLADRLKEADSDVASAAAAALGRIANDAATKSLRKSLTTAPAKVRSAIAEGLVLCAERLQAEGHDVEAIEIFDELRKADVPKQRKLEATRGAILARKQNGIPLLLEQFRSPDKAFFQLGLGTAREFQGSQVDQALAEELARAAPARAALLIHAMADRTETVELPAILKAAADGPVVVRLAALEALGRVGDASCLTPLLEIGIESDAAISQAAKAAAAELPAGKVDAEIVARLPAAKGKTLPLLLELIGLRRINAFELLVQALGDANHEVRSAALTALGATVSADQLNVLISQAAAPKYEEDAEAARLALKAAAVRMADREACAAELAAAMADAPTATKVAILEILGAVGGAKALSTLGTAAKSPTPELQDASTRLLGEWMTSDAAPVLLDLAKTGAGDKYRSRALRGYLRIARQFIMPLPERVEMCRNALAACRQPDEKKLVLEVLERYPSIATLKLAVEVAQTPELKPEAAQTARTIAQKVRGTPDQVRKILSQAGLDEK